MQVLKLFYRLILSRKFTILAMVLLFLGIVGTSNWANQEILHAEFTPKHDNLKIGIANEDTSSPVSQQLVDYLSDYGQTVDLDTGQEAIIDALYSGKADYALIIPKDYGQALVQASLDPDQEWPSLKESQGPEPGKASYVNQALASYLSSLQVNALYLKEVGQEEDLDTLLAMQEEALADEVEILDNEDKEDLDLLLFGLAFCPVASYIYFVIFTSCFGTPALAMREENVAMRERVSSLTARSKNLQFFIGCVSFFIIVWLLSMGLALIMYGPGIFSQAKGQAMTLASFISCFSLSGLAFLIANLAPNRYFLSLCEVALGLVLAFGSGIFVDLDFVGPAFQSLVSLAPPIWLVRANDLILSSQVLSQAQTSQVKTHLAIMVLLGLAYYAISFVIIRARTLAQE